jgi:hypothetical protein
VPIDKIRENDWSLATGKYKPLTVETEDHEAPAKILADVVDKENDILRRANALLKQLTK